MGFQVIVLHLVLRLMEVSGFASRCDYHLCCMPPFVFYLVLYLYANWSACSQRDRLQPDGCIIDSIVVLRSALIISHSAVSASHYINMYTYTI